MAEENIDLLGINLIKQGGDARREGLAILYKKYSKILRGFFFKELRIQAVADDLVQETFIKIIKSCDQYKGDAPLSAWIRRIAKNSLIDYVKSKQFQLSDSGDDEWWDALENSSASMHVIDPPSTGDTLEDCYNGAYKEFSKEEPERALAISYVVSEFDTRKIAGLINRTEGATREYLSQCKKKFEKYLMHCRDYITP